MQQIIALYVVLLLVGCNAVESLNPIRTLNSDPVTSTSVLNRHAMRRAALTVIEPSAGEQFAASVTERVLPGSATAIRALPSPLLGVTVDNIAHIGAVYTSFSQLKTPIARVVFDRQELAPYYSSAIKQLDTVGYTMGELVDSSDMKYVSVSNALNRTNAYLNILGSSVDLWEVGNEVNGEWLGSNVPAKVHEMFIAVKAAGGKAAMTLYYEPPQTVTKGYDMIPWEEKTSNVPADMHAGLDYVFVSYYETDNKGIRPTQAQWDTIFTRLAADFPNSKVGFGEVGMSNPATQLNLSQAENIMQYYYGLQSPALPSFVRGDFWWYFAEDCVPTSAPLFTELTGMI